MGLIRRRPAGRPSHASITNSLIPWLFVACVPVLGYVANRHVSYALAGGVVLLLLGVISTNISFLAIISLPATLVIVRAGGSTSNISTSDVVLFGATLCALLLFRISEAPEVRRLLVLLAIYQCTTLLAVLDNPYRADFIEWFHEVVMVGGSLVVGWVVGRGDRAKAAVSIYVAGATGLALWTLPVAVAHHFQPVYLPGGMQKNFIGDMLAFAVVLAYARPVWIGWSGRRWPRVSMTLCVMGIVATQSKQAMISCAVGILFLAFRDRGLSHRSKGIFLAILPFMLISYLLISGEVSSTNRFNSFHQRQTWLHEAWQLWRISPWFGVGLRWWYTNRFPFAFQPPNAEAEVLTSAGLIGLIGFAVLTIGAMRVLMRMPHPYGSVVLAILIMRLVQGQLDIFWVSAIGSFPWMIIGLACGAAALDRWTTLPLAVTHRPERLAEQPRSALS
jgi:hypothetical protein